MKRNEILDAAKAAINGDRQTDYGDPHARQVMVCALWQTWLDNRPPETDLQPWEHAVMLILDKATRLVEAPGKLDTWVDIAGYAAIGGESAIRDTEIRRRMADVMRRIDETKGRRNEYTDVTGA